MKTIKFKENGQALILIALGAVLLFGFAALTIDGSMVFSDKRHAQNAADTAVMAAALARTRGADLYVAGKARATSNGYTDSDANHDVSITTTAAPNGVCPSTGVDIQVNITSRVQTTFARILGWTQLTNHVSATSRACDYNTQAGVPLYNGSAVMSLNTDSCNGRPTKNLYVGGHGDVQITGAGFGSASPYGACVDFSGGESQVHSPGGQSCPVGLTTAAPASGANAIPPANTASLANPDHCSPFYVYSATFPPAPPVLDISCGNTPAAYDNATGTLSPGNWNTNTIPANSVKKLQPGTYCVTGGINKSSNSFSGDGVTFVMIDGEFKLNGEFTAILKAPTVDSDSFGNKTKGLLVYYRPTNSSDFTFDGKTNITLRGTILAPQSNCYFKGNNSQVQPGKYQFICDTWQVNGSAQLEIIWDSSVFFSLAQPTDPTIFLLQ